MRRKRLLWQLFPSYLVIILISLACVSWYAAKSFEGFFRKHTASNLERSAYLLRARISQYFPLENAAELNSLCRELGERSSLRITVILPDGTVVADSEEDVAAMMNHSDRPEFIDALKGHTGTSVRLSPTLQKDMMYVAVPVETDGELAAVLRTSIPTVAISKVLGNLFFKIGIVVIVVAVVAALTSFAVSQSVTQPIADIRRGADRFAKGDLNHKLSVMGSEEIGSLAEAMNRMAGELDEKIKAVVQERNELEAVLSSMVEGVLAIDTEQRLISMNHAAGDIMGVNPMEAVGRNLSEVVRNPELQRFAASILASEEPVEGEIVLHHTGERYLQTHGAVLRNPEGERIGAVLVLNDVTRLRNLENVRRDFVANVSHEIRTPITSIKGFVETLLDGAINTPEDAQRFLQIMAKQADRLNAIIEDLLTLSKVEEQTETAQISRARSLLRSVLHSAVQLCKQRASEKDIEINVVCGEDLQADLNGCLIEQAVVNLIDNAIKYSPAGSEVQVEGSESANEILITVRDHGCGIDAEHLPRLFERFYRVDKARSRELGGTGLGLAIVKHIAQAHGGYASVESTPGEGSVFSIHLPVSHNR